MEIASRTIKIALLKIFQNENAPRIPSIFLVEELGDRTPGGKPPGWSIPGGDQKPEDTEIETGWREWTGETRRYVEPELFAELVLGESRVNVLKPSRTKRGALHEDALFIAFITDEDAEKKIKPYAGSPEENLEVKRAAWFRLDALPTAESHSRGQRIHHQLSIYKSHREKLASALRKLAETNPQIFEKYGLEPEMLIRMVEPKTRLSM